MKQKIPNSPFATRLSGSAKETELRIRNIFQWKKKRPPVILLLAAVLLIAGCGSLIGFTSEDPAETGGQTIDPFVENGASTEIPGYHNTSTPEFFNDLGKTLSELKNEYPEGEFIVRLDGFPDSAAVCFGEQGAEYVYYFFGTQSGDSEKAMNECEDQLKCAGFITTANVLFPDMEDDMSFEDFFSLIGVDDYEYLLGEEVITGEGWLTFMYSDMKVMVNTNEITAGGGWDFTGAERVKSNAPVSIVDPELSNTNQDLAEPVMFEEDEEQKTVPLEELTAMEAYKAVLRGEMEFLNTPHYDSFDISRLREAITPDTSITLEPEYFTAVDMDADGMAEVIVSLAISGVGTSDYLVLRWQEGVVYGYTFAEREFSDLKTDGTFWNTGGASDVGICRVTFDGDTRSIDRFTYSLYRPSDDGISYFVDNQEATEEEWERALSQWNAIPYVEWHELTEDNIETILR